MTACVLSAVTPLRAAAADLDGERYAEPPYDERGYSDERYRDDERYRQSETYDEAAIAERPGSIKDGYPVPVPPPAAETRRYERIDRVERVERVERHTCLERWEIRDRLRQQGWFRIRPMGGNGEIVHIRARRPDSSSAFRLHVDRCSGDVLAARPEYLRSFAYGERPWDRGY
jgi:hypothetical protein